MKILINNEIRHALEVKDNAGKVTPAVTYKAGQVVDVPDEVGQAYVDCGAAVIPTIVEVKAAQAEEKK